MKKKRIIFLMVLSIAFITTDLLAQGAYVSLNAGYGLNASSQNLGTTSYNNNGTNMTTYNQEDFSFGKGIQFGGAAGYMFTKNIGVEMGLSYLTGDPTTLQSSYVNGSNKVDISSKMLRINPSIIIVSGMSGLNPYARFGVIVGTGSIIEKDNYTNNPNNTQSTQKLSGGYAYGLTAGVGVMYKLTGKISLFGELAMVNMSYAPTKGEITAYTFNGVDRMLSLSTRDRLTDYVETYTVKAGQTPPDTEPAKSLVQKLPFGSVGINIGLKYNL